ncbi:hypothetical protein [Kingella potus]|uniref:hypothetical protein n=1 Tax=Kingella potus TaxID=265175 RepID=UPI001FD62C86|nr:hypothetical protein [Kingella potus]UOP00762.1 hypothetical protein LVJ84_13520 [Kingella potus]
MRPIFRLRFSDGLSHCRGSRVRRFGGTPYLNGRGRLKTDMAGCGLAETFGKFRQGGNVGLKNQKAV